MKGALAKLGDVIEQLDRDFVQLTKCGVCDKVHPDGLEACSTCYSAVWGRMTWFEDRYQTAAVDVMLASLGGVVFDAKKASIAEDVVYRVSRADGQGPVGSGGTKALAVADLLAQLLMERS